MSPNPSYSRKAKVGDAGMAVLVDQDVGLDKMTSGVHECPT